MSFLVRVSWPEDDGHLAQMPDGSVGIAPRGDGRPLAFREEWRAAAAAALWAPGIDAVQREQGIEPNHTFRIERSDPT